MFKFMKAFENPNHPLLGPNELGLRFTGMLQKEKSFSRYIYNLIHIAATLFVLSQYVELWIIRSDLSGALRNLSISMLSTVCVFKAWTFVYWQKYWKDIIASVSKTELNQLARPNTMTAAILEGYKKYSRIVTYCYWALVTATVFTVILAPLTAYLSSADYREKIRNKTTPFPEIMSSWVPFDKSKLYGYSAYILEHALICFYGGGIVAIYDSNAVAIMSFFTGQLKLLKADCARIFGDDKKTVSSEQALANIRDCHFHHLFLIKYSRLFNSLLSPVMFLYIIICSLMICCSAIQLTQEGTTKMQQLWIVEYLMALIAQLFLYCWHGNEVYCMSTEIDNGVFMSKWWTRNVSLRRSTLLLGGQLQKTITFTAGPFTTLTLPTFVAILKGSYSYYAILNKNENSEN